MSHADEDGALKSEYKRAQCSSINAITMAAFNTCLKNDEKCKIWGW